LALENKDKKYYTYIIIKKLVKQLPLPILLKYDEDDLILHLKQFLNKMSFNTVSFTDPLLAFEHLKYSHRNYSLILKDL